MWMCPPKTFKKKQQKKSYLFWLWGDMVRNLKTRSSVALKRSMYLRQFYFKINIWNKLVCLDLSIKFSCTFCYQFLLKKRVKGHYASEHQLLLIQADEAVHFRDKIIQIYWSGSKSMSHLYFSSSKWTEHKSLWPLWFFPLETAQDRSPFCFCFGRPT